MGEGADRIFGLWRIFTKRLKQGGVQAIGAGGENPGHVKDGGKIEMTRGLFFNSYLRGLLNGFGIMPESTVPPHFQTIT